MIGHGPHVCFRCTNIDSRKDYDSFQMTYLRPEQWIGIFSLCQAVPSGGAIIYANRYTWHRNKRVVMNACSYQVSIYTELWAREIKSSRYAHRTFRAERFRGFRAPKLVSRPQRGKKAVLGLKSDDSKSNSSNTKPNTVCQFLFHDSALAWPHLGQHSREEGRSGGEVIPL